MKEAEKHLNACTLLYHYNQVHRNRAIGSDLSFAKSVV